MKISVNEKIILEYLNGQIPKTIEIENEANIEKIIDSETELNLQSAILSDENLFDINDNWKDEIMKISSGELKTFFKTLFLSIEENK